jgi:hypothetical protein
MSRISSSALAPKAPQSAPPLLVDIHTAAQTLGISVFAVRNLCWHRETARVLKPVRHGLKFLFSPAALTEFTQKLVSGEVHFPPTPAKTKSRKAA